MAESMMTLVLLLLCGVLTVVTWQEQTLTGPPAAESLAATIKDASSAERQNVLIVVRDTPAERAQATIIAEQLETRGLKVAGQIAASPRAAYQEIANRLADGAKIDFVATTDATYRWGIFERLADEQAAFKSATIIRPATQAGSRFLTTSNLLNITSQIVVIAILSIGMTMVVITAGIDLSVGALIAVSAVTCTLLIRDYGGGVDVTNLGITVCALAAIALCAAVGAFNGLMITRFRVPPFIVTLSTMLIARGLAQRLSDGQSIDRVPERFGALGLDRDVLGLPNSVLLMVALYAIAHWLMTRTVFGRYVYAVGGNKEAARLSGVPVDRVLLVVYVVCGALAGLGGIVMASQLRSGAPTYGQVYELYVIAAVVVGGTSLNGGQGRIFETLVGALIIAVINNGMNLLGVKGDMQGIVLGAVILAAVVIDRMRKE
ncbi:MAG: ABC transporter permease [Planctomycetes bacterium]|nr:ABC transporter permease [Planctomycetota bacterium]